jgi:hypothetical protein
LRECGIRKPIAGDDAVHPDVVVKEISRLGAGNFIDVLESRESADFDYFCTGQALPVETFRSQETSEVFAELTCELGRIWGDEDTFVQNNNRCRKNVLVSVVAAWVPT